MDARYIDCARCRKVERSARMRDGICEDCRSVDFSDYVVAALGEIQPYVVFFAKVRKEAQRLGLIEVADSKVD